MSVPDSTSKPWLLTEAVERKDEPTMTVTDPVCGLQVDVEQAVAHEEHGSWA